MNTAKIANKVRKLRKTRGMSIHDLADKAAISVGYLSQIENEKADPTLKEMEFIAHALGVTLHDVIDPHEHHGDWDVHWGDSKAD